MNNYHTTTSSQLPAEIGVVRIGNKLSYSVYRLEDDRLGVETSQPASENLALYVQVNHDFIKGIVNKQQKVPVVLTFAQPFLPDEANLLVKEYDLQPESAVLRTINGLGERLTIGVVPQDGVAIPIEQVMGIVEEVQELDQNGKADLKGVLSVSALADSKTLEKLLSDRRVFLVDVMQTILQNQTAAQFKVSAQEVMVGAPTHLYWLLEEQ